MGLAQRVRDELAFWPTGQPVLVACSGGSDSLALLHLLHGGSWPLRAAYLDHGDNAAAGDLVADTCQNLGVPFQRRRLQVDRWARRYGLSWEAAARDLRYRWLRAVAAEALVVTGHTADDQAETLLLRILSGSTLPGLAGVRPRTPGLARPLLRCRRAELQAWLKKRGTVWFEDPANLQERWLRVQVRQRVLPLLSEINSGVVSHLARLAEDALEVRAVGGLAFEEWLHQEWRAMQPPPHARWSRELARRVHSGPGPWNLPGEIWVERTTAGWFLGRRKVTLPVLQTAPPEHAPPGALMLPVELLNKAEWRWRRPDDRWGVNRLKKSLNRWGVPRALRDHLPLLAVGPQVVWVPGWGLRQDVIQAADQPAAGRVACWIEERNGWKRTEAPPP